MTHPQAVAEGTVITVPPTAITGFNGFHLEPRCRVCRNDQLRAKVNNLLASGASYAMIVRSLEPRRSPVVAGSSPHAHRVKGQLEDS